MRKKLVSFLKRDTSIFLFFIVVDLIFFWKYFLLGLIPIPADVIIGGYFPWLNDKWGYAVGVPVKNALMSDVVSLLYPWRLTAIEAIKSGQLPLWDPTSFLGNSLIGNFQAGIFNPFNLLFFLPFDFNKIWGLQVVIQPLLAIVFLFIMLRNWGVSKLSSIFGALSYAFSAQVLVWIEYNVHSFILAVFPLLIFSIDKYLKSAKVYWLGGISLITAYIIFVGYPQHLYYFTFFGFIYFQFSIVKNKNSRDLLLKSIYFGIAIFAGLLLSSVTLVPGLEALSLSIKSLDGVALVNEVLYLPWQNLVTGFVPDFFGNPATNNYYGLGYYESFIFYTSLTALPFAFFALGNLKKSKVLILALFLILTFVLALKNPVSELIQNMSWLGLKGSVSSRVLFVYGFSISCLAAIGLDQFKSDENKKTYLKYIPISAVTGIVVGIFISIGVIKFIFSDLTLLNIDYGNIMISLKNSVIPGTVILLTTLLIFLNRFIKKNTIFIIILIGIILIDYYRFSAKYLPFIDSKLIFPKTPLTDFLQEEKKPFRIAIERGELMPANTWSVYGLESISGYNIILPRENADYISLLNNGEVSGGYSRVMDISNPNSKFLDGANVKYLLALLRTKAVPDPLGEPAYDVYPEKYQRIFSEGSAVVFENKNYLERFYTVEDITPVESTEKAYQIMGSDSFDFKRMAVVENHETNGLVSQCDLENINYKSQEISLETNCPDTSFLVFSQLYYPGWKAAINGQDTKIIKTNGIFSGVDLPSGQSTVQIKYSPDSFKIGVLISSVTAILFLGFMLITTKLRFKK